MPECAPLPLITVSQVMNPRAFPSTLPPFQRRRGTSQPTQGVRGEGDHRRPLSANGGRPTTDLSDRTEQRPCGLRSSPPGTHPCQAPGKLFRVPRRSLRRAASDISHRSAQLQQHGFDLRSPDFPSLEPHQAESLLPIAGLNKHCPFRTSPIGDTCAATLTEADRYLPRSRRWAGGTRKDSGGVGGTGASCRLASTPARSRSSTTWTTSALPMKRLALPRPVRSEHLTQSPAGLPT